MFKLKTILLSALFLCMSITAWAHPHVWIYTDVSIKAQDNAFNRIHVKWQFDEMYSAAFLLDVDKNYNRKLEDSEVQVVKDLVFGADNELQPFMYFAQGTNRILPQKFENIKVSLTDDGMLIYEFDILLDNQITLSGKPKVAFFDPEFYISFEQHPDMVFEGSDTCQPELIEDQEILIYNGLMNPEIYTFNCKA